MADANSGLYIRPDLSAIAIKYRQDDMIADDVMPRVPVEKQEFIYLADRIQDWITPIDTEVGRVGRVNQIGTSFQDPVTLSTRNQGLDEIVPNQDVMNGPTESALGRATELVMSLVALKRELRVAAICNNAANFEFSAALSGSALFSDTGAGYVSPIVTLNYYLNQPFKRPNVIVMGRMVWTQLSQHPAILAAAFGAVNPQGNASVSQQRLADILEVKKIIVGDGWVNTANKGQPVNMQRIWGNMLIAFYQGQQGQENGNSWGYTAQFGDRIAGTLPKPSVGLFGGVAVRAGESVLEVVTAPQFGFQLAPVM